MTTKQATSKKKANKQQTFKSENLLAAAAFILPFLAWLIAALINPSGWMSDSPAGVLTILIYVPVIYWPATLVVCIFIIIYLYYRKPSTKGIATLLLVISAIFSSYIFQLTVTADDSEFTG